MRWMLLSLPAALLLSYIVVLMLGRPFLRLMEKLRAGQPVRDFGPRTHIAKQGVPTMGGLLMAGGLLVGVLAAAVVLLLTGAVPIGSLVGGLLFPLLFGAIGFLDDWLKVVRQNSDGLHSWLKVVLQVLVSGGMAVFLLSSPLSGVLSLPFLGEVEIGYFFLPYVVLVSVAVVNSANLADGCDGLLGNVTLPIFLFFAALVLLPFSNVNEGLLLLALAGTGAVMGFLHFNTFPARLIMGDTGSFLLGGLVAYLALSANVPPLVLCVLCVVFVITSGSDILQLVYGKLRRGERLYRMAPYHHHLELGGMPETRIVGLYTRLSILGSLLALLFYLL